MEQHLVGGGGHGRHGWDAGGRLEADQVSSGAVDGGKSVEHGDALHRQGPGGKGRLGRIRLNRLQGGLVPGEDWVGSWIRGGALQRQSARCAVAGGIRDAHRQNIASFGEGKIMKGKATVGANQHTTVGAIDLEDCAGFSRADQGDVGHGRDAVAEDSSVRAGRQGSGGLGRGAAIHLDDAHGQGRTGRRGSGAGRDGGEAIGPIRQIACWTNEAPAAILPGNGASKAGTIAKQFDAGARLGGSEQNQTTSSREEVVRRAGVVL